MAPADPTTRLHDELLSYGHVLIALSGGVDSSLLLLVAASVLGPEHVLAVTAISPLLKQSARSAATAAASFAGVQQYEIETDELSIAAVRQNGSERCFACRANLYRHLRQIAQQHGVAVIADGTQLDDLQRPDRPGLKAALAFGIRHPLAAAGLDKRAVRDLARTLGLPQAELAADACLATRIRQGDPLTPVALSRVEQAEALLARWFSGSLRVRLHGQLARIELEDDALVLALALRQGIVALLTPLGFEQITLDLRGYRPSGLPGA